ncbi:DUF1365-domain-containing protein [Penicillium taxi]|uniref:DUF1365-domain-containing protein n=1 Tax=Penicillium taxi TaxID=168475 RepID=UPI0025456B15|nr:DUF1365-domain-containing protein [Penicillium taxi]KAJ5898760.1 DUF1365-domain-containing protein [Penicillium taxi]
MYPCVLRHIRLAPSGFKDEFSHTYLYIGVPIGLRACYSPLISVDSPPESRAWYNKAFFSIRPQDNLFRGGAALSLAQKLEEFLLTEGENPNEWGYCYFLTLPSANGQSFNPLSFYYLYTPEKKLGAMIIQLDTSYVTRRLWFARNCREEGSKSGPFTFRCKFEKDLQISPFMPVSGANYVIDSSDPLASPNNHANLLINLRNGNESFMLGRVTTISEPLVVEEASFGSRLLFLAKWWYIPTGGFIAFRILREAARIYLKQPKENLNIQTRTEQSTTSIARYASKSEM